MQKNNDMEKSEIVLYQPDETIQLEVRMEEETVWLTQQQMTLLFGRDKSVISRHIRNIFLEGEVSKEATVAFFATVQFENDRQVMRQLEYYNLDVIISVGYRVKSIRGTQFRQWATRVLKERLLHGFEYLFHNFSLKNHCKNNKIMLTRKFFLAKTLLTPKFFIKKIILTPKFKNCLLMLICLMGENFIKKISFPIFSLSKKFRIFARYVINKKPNNINP